LRTRTSTLLIVRGFGEQLKDVRNWRLINRWLTLFCHFR
jgi:hypothetical protein